MRLGHFVFLATSGSSVYHRVCALCWRWCPSLCNSVSNLIQFYGVGILLSAVEDIVHFCFGYLIIYLMLPANEIGTFLYFLPPLAVQSVIVCVPFVGDGALRCVTMYQISFSFTVLELYCLL